MTMIRDHAARVERWIPALLAILTASIFYLNVGQLTLNPPSFDGAHHLNIAFNLAYENRFSAWEDSTEPYARREPLFPVLLALGMRSSDLFLAEGFSARCPSPSTCDLFLTEGFSALTCPSPSEWRTEPCKTGIAWLKMIPVAMVIALAWVVYFLLRILGVNVYLAAATCALTALHGGLLREADRFYTEPLAALCFGLIAIFNVKVVQEPRVRNFLALALASVALVHTKAVFQLYWVFQLAVFALIAYRSPAERRRRILIGTTVFVALYGALVGGWMLRNYVNDLGFTLSQGRGGGHLLLRATFNDMTVDEWRAGLTYYNPRERLRVGSRQDWTDPTHPAHRLHRSNEKSFYQEGLRRIRRLSPEAASKQGIKEILAHPVKHMWTAVLFLYRGSLSSPSFGHGRIDAGERLFDRLHLPNRSYSIYMWPRFWFSPIIALCVFLAIIVGMARADLAVVAAFLPVAFWMIAHAIFSYFIVRYSVPIYPLQIAVAVLVLDRASRWFIRLLKLNPH